MSLAASPLRPASLPPGAVHLKERSDFFSAASLPVLFPQNVQCRHVVCVLSNLQILQAKFRPKLNWKQPAGRLWSPSIQESRQLLNLSDSFSFLYSIPERAWTFFYFLFFVPKPQFFLFPARDSAYPMQLPLNSLLIFLAAFCRGRDEKVLQNYKHSPGLMYGICRHVFRCEC